MTSDPRKIINMGGVRHRQADTYESVTFVGANSKTWQGEEYGTFVVPQVMNGEAFRSDQMRLATRVSTTELGGVITDPTEPRDLPGLRTEFLNAWQYGNSFHTALRVQELADSKTTWCGQKRTLQQWEQDTIAGARLLWVSDDLTEAVEDLRDTLGNEVTLDMNDAPWPSGMAVFAHQIRGMAALDSDVVDPGELRVRAIVWGPVRLQPVPEHDIPMHMAVGISSYDLLDLSAGLEGTQLAVASPVLMGAMSSVNIPANAVSLIGKMWSPLGRSDWPVNAPVSFRWPWNTDQQQASFEEDRRLLYTLWHLMRQEEIVTVSEVHRSKKAAKRRSTKAKDQPVTVMHLRRTVVRDSDEVSSRPGRRQRVRYPVAAHWRNQAYGPQRSLRKRILVAGHWRGPEDGPVVVNEKVWALDR